MIMSTSSMLGIDGVVPIVECFHELLSVLGIDGVVPIVESVHELLSNPWPSS